MQAYSSPLPAPAFNVNAEPADWRKADEDFKLALRMELLRLGWQGKLTGEVIRFPIADGYAQYMVAQSDRKVALVHVPLGDAWRIPDAHLRGLRKADVVALVEREKSYHKLFGRKEAQ